VRPESPAIIFVVDDDEVVRESLKALLEARRYVVLDFPSGVEFLSRRDGARADCVVMDVHMPYMTGIEVLKRLRQAGDSTPVILVTGSGDAAIAGEAVKLGVPVFEKPVPPAAIMGAIERALLGLSSPPRHS
jgi:FixJ family two-component response regulator